MLERVYSYARTRNEIRESITNDNPPELLQESGLKDFLKRFFINIQLKHYF